MLHFRNLVLLPRSIREWGLFKNEFGQQNVQVALLSCYSNLIHPDPHEREKILQKFERYLFMHAILGRQWLLRKRVPLFPHLVTVKKISQMKFLMSL